MGETIILQNIELYKALFIDRLLLFVVAFALLMIGSYIKARIMKQSYREIVLMSIFFAMLSTLAIDKLISLFGKWVPAVIFLLGPIQKECLYMLRKFTIKKAEDMLNVKLDEKDEETNSEDKK